MVGKNIYDENRRARMEKEPNLEKIVARLRYVDVEVCFLSSCGHHDKPGHEVRITFNHDIATTKNYI